MKFVIIWILLKVEQILTITGLVSGKRTPPQWSLDARKTQKSVFGKLTHHHHGLLKSRQWKSEAGHSGQKDAGGRKK